MKFVTKTQLLFSIVLTVLGMSRLSLAGGGMDLTWYCNQFFQAVPVLTSNDVYGWRCEQPGGYQINIDTNDVCFKQYNSYAGSYFTNFNDVNSWVCR